MSKERFQNPVVGDELKLRVFAYNSNNYRNFNSVTKVEIYAFDDEKTAANPDGRRLVQTIESADVSLDSTGQYSTSVILEQAVYTIGRYSDVWTVEVESGETEAQIENSFEIFPDLWFTSPVPVVYGFDFSFRPNKIRQGSKNYLIIDITPNVPKTSDLNRYYQNLAIVSPLKVSIEQECGECLPAEQDLRLVVDCELVELREKCVGYYYLDTTEMDCGIYNVWFQMDFGDTVHISDKQQIQIY